MEFRILGPFEVVDGDLVLRLPTGRARALLAVLVLRRKLATAPRPYRLPGYPVVPLIFLLVMVWIVVSALIRNPKESIATVLLILLGLPLYPLFRGRRLL